MNNTFKITISAVDKATAVVRSVKNSFSQITRPVSDLQSVVTSLGRETGLDKVGKSIFDISTATSSLASRMAGAFPALAGGLSAAAIATMAGRWADLGTEVNKTSHIIGVSSQELQEFRGVARRADVAPEALDNGLKNLGSTMENVLYDRGGEVNAVVKQMGIQFKNTAGGFEKGTPDIVNGLMQVADATRRLQANPLAQRHLLESLGLSEDLLPVLRLGKQGILEYVAAYQKTHGMISEADIKRASAFKESIIDLGDALGGLGTRIIANASLLTRLMNTTAAFVAGEGANSIAHTNLAGRVLNSASAVAHIGLAGRVLNSASAAAPKVSDLLTDALPGGIVTDMARHWLKGDTGTSQPIPDANSSVPLPPSGARSPPGSIPLPPPSDSIYLNAPAPPAVDQPAPTPNAVAAAASAQAPKISIELLLKNAPPGTQARARTPDGQSVPARIEYSMPTTVTP